MIFLNQLVKLIIIYVIKTNKKEVIIMNKNIQQTNNISTALIEVVELLKIERDKSKRLNAINVVYNTINNNVNVTLAEFAQLISSKDSFIIGRNRLTKLLREVGVLTNNRNKPNEEFVNNGMIKYNSSSRKLTITEKGQVYLFDIVNKYLFENYTPEQW